jgi:hypothetical protein
MGRAGIEPATLGLKVRLDELQRTASDGKVLQRAGIAFAMSCSKMQVAETSLYAQPYAQEKSEGCDGRGRSPTLGWIDGTPQSACDLTETPA